MRGTLASLILTSLGAVAPCPAAGDEPARGIDYIILEGGGPDQGPGPDVLANIAALRAKLGPVDPTASRMYGYGVQQLRILSRTDAVVAADVGQALDAAERTGVPVFLHIDSCYAWGADTEAHPGEAPAAKFWEHPEMREWGEFPAADGALPEHIPRLWLHWGPWCSPAPAVPALGSPKFVELARARLAGGVIAPLASRLEKWRREGRSHLFAGINIAWEAHIPQYPARWRDLATRHDDGIRAGYPVHLKGLRMDPRIPGLQLGYASLHWRGWNEVRLEEAARKEGIPRDEKFRRLCYDAIRDYMEALSKTCHDGGIPAGRVYTHIVALASTGDPNTNHPPIATAVNRYSTPGFTMDNKGAARYDLDRLVRQVAEAPGSRRAGFGAVETYFRLGDRTYVTDPAEYRREIDTLFAAGARIKVVYGAFPLNRAPGAAFAAIAGWLDDAR